MDGVQLSQDYKMGFNYLKTTVTTTRQFTFYHGKKNFFSMVQNFAERILGQTFIVN